MTKKRFFYDNSGVVMAINRRRLSLETSLAIDSQKFCGVKSIQQNIRFVKESSSDNLFYNINEVSVYLIFVKLIFKSTPNRTFLEFLSKNELCLHKVTNLKDNAIFGELLKHTGGLGELISSESVYFIAINDISKYLEVLRKCLSFESTENADAYFSFNVLCSKEGEVFINFDDRLSYKEIRQIYNLKRSKADILFEFSGILNNNLISFGSSLSAELVKNSSPLYPNIN